VAKFRNRTSLGGTRAEIEGGVAMKVAKNTTLWASAGYSRSLDHAHDRSWAGKIGVTVKF
jgi:outer membrane autotransporter protein